MNLKTLKDFDVTQKRVLLRTDLNSDVEKGKVILSERIKEAALTINYLKKSKARIIILAHQGNKGKDDFLSLEAHAKFLNKYTKVSFVADTIGEKAKKAIEKMKAGDALVLENVRFLDDELDTQKEKNRLVKILVPLCDLYVNDAFSVCHRDQTSISLFPKYLPSCAVLLLERAISALEKISIVNCLYILV